MTTGRGAHRAGSRSARRTPSAALGGSSTDAALEPIVDMVLLARDGAYEARTPRRLGAVPARATPGDVRGASRSTGADPLADQSTDRFTPLADELAHPNPHRSENAYPFAYEQIAQLFDHPAAPDLCVIHSAEHNWEDQGGHRGEHGSLGVVQARAPFVLAGKGVRADGLVPRAARLVDVAPTVARAARRARPTPTAPTSPARTASCATTCSTSPAGARRTSSCSSSTARTRTCSTTWPRGARRRTSRGSIDDGHGVRARRDGGAADRHAREPHVDPHRAAPRPPRDPAQRVVRPPDRRADHHQLERHLAAGRWSTRSTGVESIHTVAAPPRARTRSPRRSTSRATSTPTTRRSTSSAAARSRRSRRAPKGSRTRPSGSSARRRTTRGRRSSTTWAPSRPSGSGTATYRDETYPLPRFMFCNFTLTDAAMHEGGPYSEIAAASIRDSDARIGEIIDAVERAGVFDDTAFVLVADHGMEENEPGRARRLGRRAARRRPHVPRRGLRLPLPRRAPRLTRAGRASHPRREVRRSTPVRWRSRRPEAQALGGATRPAWARSPARRIRSMSPGRRRPAPDVDDRADDRADHLPAERASR